MKIRVSPLVALGTMFFLSLAVMVGFSATLFTSPVTGKHVVVESTPATLFQLMPHAWFQLRYKEILALDMELQAAEVEERSHKARIGSEHTWSDADRAGIQVSHNKVVSLRKKRSYLVNLYNSRAKVAGEEVFILGDVPLELN